MYCTNCGANVEDGIKFCTKCGCNLQNLNNNDLMSSPEILNKNQEDTTGKKKENFNKKDNPNKKDSINKKDKVGKIDETNKKVKSATKEKSVKKEKSSSKDNKSNKKKKSLKRKFVKFLLILLLILLLAGAVLVIITVNPFAKKNKKTKTNKPDTTQTSDDTEKLKGEMNEILASLAEVKNISISGENEEKTMTADVSMPNLKPLLENYVKDNAPDEYSKDAANELLSKFISDLPELVTEDSKEEYQIEVNLYDEAFEIVYSVNYLENADKVIAPEEYEFSDEELEKIAIKYAIRIQFADLMDEYIDALDLEENGIAPEWWYSTED